MSELMIENQNESSSKYYNEKMRVFIQNYRNNHRDKYNEYQRNLLQIVAVPVFTGWFFIFNGHD